MNALQQDILNTIRKHGASRTVEICEDLMPLGYGGTMSFDDFKTWIGKTISKMKAEGHVIGEDRPNPGTKPVRYWALPEAVNQQMTTEMESDIAEIEQGEWSDAKTFECEPEQAPEIPEPDYEPSSVAFRKVPMTVDRAICALGEAGFSHDDMPAFMSGIAAAERHHGIAG
jgi:hypothetical protein